MLWQEQRQPSSTALVLLFEESRARITRFFSIIQTSAGMEQLLLTLCTLTPDTGWGWEGKAAPAQLPSPARPSAFMHIPASCRHGAGGGEAKDGPGDGGSLREVLDQGSMLLHAQVAAGHRGGVLRSGGGGEQRGEDRQPGRLRVLQPPLPLATHVLG